jgi:hypothetical protein
MVFKKIFPAPLDLAHGVVTVPLTFVSTCGEMRCHSSSKIKSSLVIDSGALVCISLHKKDFIDYGASAMTIKDLLSFNNVAGERIISWNLEDIHGSIVKVEVKRVSYAPRGRQASQPPGSPLHNWGKLHSDKEWGGAIP